MPIPGSVLSGMLPFGLGAVAGMYPSRLTLRPMTKTRDTTGQWKHTFADSTDSTQVSLPCRLSPLIQIRPQNQEKATASNEQAEALMQLNLSSYVNVDTQTLLTWQAKVDGVVYQIKAVENDGSKLTTRFMLANINQFEA